MRRNLLLFAVNGYGVFGSGLKANVTDKLNDILLRAVTTNAKFSDLQEELRAHLLGKDGGQGAFARYATTYATTALSQFTGQNNKLLTDDLDCEWFMYVGSNKETTREFCSHLTAKKFVHRSEIPDLLKGKIDDYQCAIYPKTNLPYGMIEGTTPDNFQCNCGGWNCRHQLIPVADAVVPLSIRQRLKKVQAVRKQADTLRQSGNYKDVQTNAMGGLKAIHNGHIVHSAQNEETFFEEHLTSTQLELACQNQLYQLGHSAILRDESTQDSNGNQLPALDLELDGKLMDIASITQGKFGSALLNKNRQLKKVASKTGYIGEEVCLYIHDKTMFSKEKLLQDIDFFKAQAVKYKTQIYIKRIHIVINGDTDIYTYEI